MNADAVRGRDPVLDVTGIAATEILRRCEEIRRLRRGGRSLRDAGPTADAWRLLDFADLGDEEFVVQAHRILLGREPSRAETERRLREVHAGTPRLAIVVRLALAPEGRRAARPPVRGPGLRLLARIGLAIESASATPVLARGIRAGERLMRSILARRSAR